MQPYLLKVRQRSPVHISHSSRKNDCCSVPFSVLNNCSIADHDSVKDIVRFKRDVRQNIAAVLADSDTSTKGRHSVFHELKDSSILPAEEKTIDRLEDEATLLVMAGTESPAKSLGIAAFYLLHQPEMMEKLRSEITEAKQVHGRALSVPDLLGLPYLSAVLTEAVSPERQRRDTEDNEKRQKITDINVGSFMTNIPTIAEPPVIRSNESNDSLLTQ